MRTLGLVGGTSWVSTLEYYKLINEGVNKRLGGAEAARCILYSLNFGDLLRSRQADPAQRGVRDMVVQAARTLAGAGAEGIVLCANTLHWFAGEVEQAAGLPLVHIADAAARAVRARGMTRVGLLGTRPTMEQPFYRERLSAAGVETLVPGDTVRGYVDDAIIKEMVRDIFLPETRRRFLDIIASLAERGAEGVVLGCTEIPLLLAGVEAVVPTFDTLALHAEAVVDFAVSG